MVFQYEAIYNVEVVVASDRFSQKSVWGYTERALHRKSLFYIIGKFVLLYKKRSPKDAHSRVMNLSLREPVRRGECAKAHSFLYNRKMRPKNNYAIPLLVPIPTFCSLNKYWNNFSLFILILIFNHLV